MPLTVRGHMEVFQEVVGYGLSDVRTVEFKSHEHDACPHLKQQSVLSCVIVLKD